MLGAGPDLVALQEVTRSTAPGWREILEGAGFAVHVALAPAAEATPGGPLLLVSAYVPQARNGWVKVETLEALPASLAAPGPPRILAGDLNTPRTETVDGRVATFAQRRVGGRPVPERGERWISPSAGCSSASRRSGWRTCSAP